MALKPRSFKLQAKDKRKVKDTLIGKRAAVLMLIKYYSNYNQEIKISQTTFMLKSVFDPL